MYPRANPPWKFAATLLIAAKSKLKPTTPFDYKLLLLRRSAKSSFMPNLTVFPGGGVDNGDFSSRWTKLFRKSGYDVKELNHELRAKNRAEMLSERYYPKSELSTDLAFRICAIRETFEESGVLVARRAGHGSRLFFQNENDDDGRSKWRRKVYENAESFVDMCEEMDIVPDVWSLSEWADWLTPLGSKATKRFDAIFYICTPEQTVESMGATHDDNELVHMEWLDPSEALMGLFTKNVSLAPPQTYEMLRLANFRTQHELENFQRARGKEGLDLTFPVRYQCEDGIITTMPGDDLYPKEVNYANPEPPSPLKCSVLDRRTDEHLHRFEVMTDGPKRVLCNIQLPYGHVGPLDLGKMAEIIQGIKSKI